MAKLPDISGRWAVVTGASSGIGLQFCHRLGEGGCNLVMISNEAAPLERCAAEVALRHGVETAPLWLDLTDADCAAKVEEFLDRRGIDASIMINNAGIFSFAPVAESSEGRLNCFVDLHVRAVTMLSRAMAIRFAARGGGWILNMSSMSCWMPMPGLAMYAATKSYIRVFSRALHYEMRDSGVRVCVACPGGIATDLFGLPPNLQRLALRLRVLDTPEELTRNALRRMLKGKAQYINGFLNRASILFVGITPGWLRMKVKHMMLDKGITRP